MTPKDVIKEANDYWAQQYPATVNAPDADVAEPDAGIPDDDPDWVSWQEQYGDESD